jgi:glycosyltransferase involved in cell wall biosynthesis
MNDSFGTKLAQQERAVRAIFIGSYIPRECGIATFTKDLTTAINVLNPNYLAEIMAIDEPGGESREYPWEVKYRIHQNDLDSYATAADYINQSSADIVSVQHEFGLFGGEEGEYIVPFLERIEKPVVTTFHTVLEKPSKKKLQIVKEIARISKVVVVMIETAADRLYEVYGIPAEKIVIIPHGVPDIPYGPTNHFKQNLGFEQNFTLTTFGLLSPGKGLEYVLRALPDIVRKHAETKFLILGQTHPTLIRKHGEVYRESLQAIIKELHLENNVHFENRYLSLDEVVNYLRATDVYITPYLEPQQITSGTLAYAVGAGRPCVSTEYLYAKEVLSEKRGMLVPLKNSAAIAKAVNYLIEHPEEKMEIEKNAYLYGRKMIWSNVALKHLNLFWLIAHEAKKVGLKNGNQS